MERRTHLCELLSRYCPANGEEAAHRDAMLELLAVDGDPFSRHHQSPGHFTASAFVVDSGRAAVLLILHRSLGRWLQPGGHVDPDDRDIVGAAQRELREETGLEGLVPVGGTPLDLDVHEIPARGEEPRHRHFDVRFLFVADGQSPTASADVADIRWWPISELIGPEHDVSVRRAVQKILETGLLP